MNSDDMAIMAAAARETLPLPENFDGRIRDVCRALPDKTEAHRRRRLTPALAAAATRCGCCAHRFGGSEYGRLGDLAYPGGGPEDPDGGAMESRHVAQVPA